MGFLERESGSGCIKLERIGGGRVVVLAIYFVGLFLVFYYFFVILYLNFSCVSFENGF